MGVGVEVVVLASKVIPDCGRRGGRRGGGGGGGSYNGRLQLLGLRAFLIAGGSKGGREGGRDGGRETGTEERSKRRDGKDQEEWELSLCRNTNYKYMYVYPKKTPKKHAADTYFSTTAMWHLFEGGAYSKGGV